MPKPRKASRVLSEKEIRTRDLSKVPTRVLENSFVNEMNKAQKRMKKKK